MHANPFRLLSSRKDIILQATRHLEARLTQTRPPPDGKTAKRDTAAWRTSTKLFTPGKNWKSGGVLLYPTGFQQGHTVCPFTLRNGQRVDVL